MTILDPDAEALLTMAAAANQPPWESLSPEDARQAMSGAIEYFAAATPPVDLRDISIPCPHGEVAARVYRPHGAVSGGRLGGLVFFHGGGWVLGNLDSHQALCAEIANRAGIGVVAVDYPLAPEHPFPQPLEACIASVDWIAANAGELGIDKERLAVGGDSAGGNMSSVVALHRRDAKAPPVRAQVLLYPVTDLTMSHDSYRRNADGYFLTRSMMAWFRGHYLPPAEDCKNWRVSPLHAETLAYLPPAFVLTCGFDPLCDEGQAYAHRMMAAGVSVLHSHYADQLHGFLSWGKVVRSVNPAIDEIAQCLRQRLRQAPD